MSPGSETSTRKDPLALLEGLLDPVQGLIGKQAGTSLFHFAAVQEGRRIGRSHGAEGVGPVLAHIDNMLEQRTEIQEQGAGRFLLFVHRGAPVDAAAPSGRIVVGLLEGAIAELRGEPYTATLDPGAQSNGTLRLMLRPSREVTPHGGSQ